jgi:hypothetical protein
MGLNIDWDFLYRQKLRLLNILNNKSLTEDEKNDIEGLINLLDNMGDEAEKQGLFTYPESEE